MSLGMTRPDFTPGPWTIIPEELELYGTANIQSNATCAALGCSALPRKQSEANTRAIAALPSCFEALESIAAGGCSREDMRGWAKEALAEAGYKFK